jgi:Spy/CpxP family protein refolding chaperone
MSRQFRWALAVLVACGVAGARLDAAHDAAESDACEQSPPQQPRQSDDRRQQPRGPRFDWWEDATLRAEVGISERQAGKIKTIFEVEMVKLRAMREDLEKQRDLLGQTMKDEKATLAMVTEQVERVGELHASMYRTRELMLYRIYRVLSPEQRKRLDVVVERLEKARRQEQDRRR